MTDYTYERLCTTLQRFLNESREIRHLDQPHRKCLDKYLNLFSAFQVIPQYVLDNQVTAEAVCKRDHKGSTAHFQQIKDIFEEMDALNELNNTAKEVQELRLLKQQSSASTRVPKPTPTPKVFRPIRIDQSGGKTRVKSESNATAVRPIELITIMSSDDEEMETVAPVAPLAANEAELQAKLAAITAQVATLEENKQRYQLIIGIILFVYALNIFTFFFVKYNRMYS